jgi:hypothetical protein
MCYSGIAYYDENFIGWVERFRKFGNSGRLFQNSGYWYYKKINIQIHVE